MREELEGAIASQKNAEYDRSRMVREYAEIQQKCFSQEETIKALSKIKNEREAEIIALDSGIDFTGTIPRGELVKHINKNFPGVDFKGNQIGDCLCINLKTGKPKSQKLSTYESIYGFKYVGMFEGEHRFRLNSNP